VLSLEPLTVKVLADLYYGSRDVMSITMHFHN